MGYMPRQAIPIAKFLLVWVGSAPRFAIVLLHNFKQKQGPMTVFLVLNPALD
jgi:hypothetical protein